MSVEQPDRPPVSVWDEARTELWFAWAEIAIDREREASRGRRSALRAIRKGGDPTDGLERETMGSMTAIVAAAAAVETMGMHLLQFIAPPPRQRSGAARFLAAIAGAFPGAYTAELATDVEWLFALRNEASHYRSDWRALGVHPVLGLRTTHVALTYSLEKASRSIDIVLAVLRAATVPGLSDSDPAEFWAIHWRSLPAELEASRVQSRT